MNKQVDMQAFVGVDFDCEFAYNFTSPFHRRTMLVGGFHDDGWKSTRPNGRDTLYWHESGEARPSVRPRLNKPQVLDDWSFVPDGLVWRSHNYKKDITSEQLRNFEDWTLNVTPFFFACIGAEPDYTEWANAHGVPVVEVGNG